MMLDYSPRPRPLSSYALISTSIAWLGRQRLGWNRHCSRFDQTARPSVSLMLRDGQVFEQPDGLKAFRGLAPIARCDTDVVGPGFTTSFLPQTQKSNRIVDTAERGFLGQTNRCHSCNSLHQTFRLIIEQPGLKRLLPVVRRSLKDTSRHFIAAATGMRSLVEQAGTRA